MSALLSDFSAFPLLVAGAQSGLSEGLTPGGWAAMLVSVGFVGTLFVWCLVRVFRAKS
ncbi:MAG: hypothetical protein LBV54_00885 [Puniceicoccales bacterium]|nr:hypothetical protein [Puniceicoccales bacterium]